MRRFRGMASALVAALPTTVTTTNATAIHVDARLGVATLGGTWRDSAGNSGTFAFTPGAGTGGSSRPIPAGGIAPGSITAAQLEPSAVSGAVGALGTCPVGQYLRGFQGGAAVCEPVGLASVVTTLEPGATDVGIWASVALGPDGLPVIAYYDSTNGDPRVTHCNNLACTSSTSTAADTANVVGWFPSIAIGPDGFPIISYYDSSNADLRVMHCIDAARSGGTGTAVHTAGNAGFVSAIAIGAAGRPLLAYTAYDNVSTTELRLATCANVACSSATSVRLEADTDLGEIDLAVVGGRPTITWVAGNGALHLIRCADSACGTWSTSTLRDTDRTSMVAGPDGIPTIAYGTQNGVAVIRCNDIACSSFVDTVVDVTGQSNADPDVVLGADGLRFVAFRDTARLDLRVAKCASRTCR